MIDYTGYGAANELLNELEELKLSAEQRARNLQAENDTRIKAQATVDAYAFCQHRLMRYFGGTQNGEN